MSNNEPTHYVEALFQQSIDVDLDLQRITVYGNLIFRTLSREALHNPIVTLQITPTTSLLSGKILSPELVQAVGVYTRSGKQTGWRFTESDWFKRGRVDGLYRIESIESITMHPGVWVEIKDWQVEAELATLQGPLNVSGWVEVANQKFSIMNPIQIHLSK